MTTEREKFEVFARPRHLPMMLDDDGDYLDCVTFYAFQSWLASRTSCKEEDARIAATPFT